MKSQGISFQTKSGHPDKGSAKRFKEAENIAELLGEHFLKPEKQIVHGG